MIKPLIPIYAINWGYPSVAHSYVMANKPAEDICSLINAGAELHGATRVIYPYRFWVQLELEVYKAICDFRETPTSVSMFSSDSFESWRKGLALSEIDIEQFVEDELWQYTEGKLTSMPLREAGWTKETLLLLLRCNFVASSCKRVCSLCPKCKCKRSCIHCSREPGHLKQPRWLQFLGLMKRNERVLVRHKGNKGKGLKDSGSVESESKDQFIPSLPKTFCAPGHKGCYICEKCWLEKLGFTNHIILTRDLDPDVQIVDVTDLEED